jgi:hypothetical protein
VWPLAGARAHGGRLATRPPLARRGRPWLAEPRRAAPLAGASTVGGRLALALPLLLLLLLDLVATDGSVSVIVSGDSTA